MDEDVHNPFGEVKSVKKRPGVFDPGYKGDGEDPFKTDDDRWEEIPEPPSTRDV